MRAISRQLGALVSALVISTCACIAPGARAAPVPIGAEDDWAPFSSDKDGKPVGMAVDIVRAIFAEAGIEIELVAMPYERCMRETLAGRLAGCFDTTPDAILERNYLFHAKPLFSDPTVIVAPAASIDSGLKVQDLRRKRVAITHGYTYGDEFERDTAIIRETVTGDINGLRMVAARRVDYAIVYERVLGQLLRGLAAPLRDQIKPVGQVRMNDLYLSFSRSFPDNADRIRAFEAAHSRLLANGTIAKIQKRWE